MVVVVVGIVISEGFRYQFFVCVCVCVCVCVRVRERERERAREAELSQASVLNTHPTYDVYWRKTIYRPQQEARQE